MAKDYKNKKGATGKKYTTVGDVIKVTYTDGSTRVVRPTDASYAVTKRDMLDDISSKKLFKSGNSKTTAQTALGANSTGAGVVTTAKQKAQQDNYRNVVNQRRAQEQAVSGKLPAQQTAQVVNNAINAMLAQKAVNTAKGVTTKALKSGVEHGVHNTVSGLNQGMAGALNTLGRAGMVEGVPYAALANNMAKNLDIQRNYQKAMDTQRIGMGQLQKNLAMQDAVKRQQIANKYGQMTGGEQFVSDIVSNLIPIAPSMAAGVIGGGVAPALGTVAAMAPMYTYARGLSTGQALQDGATVNQANAYGIGKGMVETGTEMLTKNMAGLPGKFEVGKKLADAVTNPTAKKVGAAAGDILSGAGEEALAELADPFLQNATYKDGEKIDMDAVLYSALLGGVMTGGVNAAAYTAQNVAKMMQEAKNAQANGQKQAQIAQKPQNAPEQAQNNATAKGITAQPEVAQEQSSQADFQQNQAKIMQEAQPVKKVQNGGKKAAFTPLEMAERTFENVKDKNVLAYQQQNPEVKPYQQDVASRLLYDLQMGEQGRREYGIDAETRNVTTMHGISRNQSEPIERMLQDGMSYKQIKDGLNRIVEDNGKENTVNAKRAELYVNDAVRNGYRSIAEGDVAADRTYAYRGMNAEQLQQEFDRVMAAVGDESHTDEQRQQLLAQADAIYNIMEQKPAAKESEVENLQDEMKNLRYKQLQFVSDMIDKVRSGHEPTNAEQKRIDRILERLGIEETFYGSDISVIDDKIAEEMAAYENRNWIEAGERQMQKTVAEQSPMIETENVAAEESSMVEYEDYDARKLSRDVFDFYSQVGKVGGKAHFNIRVVQKLEHDAEGKSDGRGNILISAERANDIETIRRVVAHEVYHEMKNTPEWGNIQDLAYELYKLEYPDGTQEDMLQAKIDQYHKLSKGAVQLDFDAAWDEIGAEMMGKILSNPKMADRVWNQNPTLAQRIKRWLEDMVAKLYDYVTISGEDSIYRRALEAYSDGLKNMEYHGQSSEAGENRYYLNDMDRVQERFAERVDDIAVNGNVGNEMVLIGKTPDALKYLGYQDAPIFMSQKHVYTLFRSNGKYADANYHDLGDIVKQLPMAIQKPLIVAESKDGGSTVMLTEMSDKKGNPVIAVIKFNGKARAKGKLQIEANILLSAYGKRNANNFFTDLLLDDKFLYVDKKRSPLLHSMSWLQLPRDVTTEDFSKNVAQFRQKVNSTVGKSGGVRYSLPKMPNQKYIDQSDENLRNFMEGSAVVNEDGSPKVVYSGHGNTNLFGTSFDKKRATAGGFYFTANPDIESNYAKDKLGVKEYYENGDEYRIKNEKGQYKLKLQDIRLTDEQVEKFDEWFEEDLGWTYEDFVNERGRYDSRYRNLRYLGGKRSLYNLHWLMEELGYTLSQTNYTKDGVQYSASVFEELMDAMGIEWDSYTQKSGGVFPIYLSIKNPIDTSQPFPQDVMKRLERIASRERRMTWEELDEAHWTANYPVYKWIEDIKRMEETGEETYWATQVPTKARKILQEMGYDGIKDTGGKMGGEEHEVWIAFEPTQVKSAIGNRGTYDATKKDMRYSLNTTEQLRQMDKEYTDAVGSQEYKDLLDEHGSIPEGENPTGENYRVEVPRKGLDGKKVREFVRTIMEAPSVDDAVANMFAQELIDPEQVLSGILTMESTSNKALVDVANESIATKGWQQNYKDLHSRMTTGDKITAQDIALATRVAQEAQKAGDAHATFDILTDLTVVASEFGQGLQAVKILKRLSPEGQLMAFMKTQKRINDSLEKQGKKRVKTMSKETAEEFLKARGNKKRDEIMARELARMGQETEGTWTDKLDALRYAGMLSNPKTHLRNIFGNIMMAVVHQPTVAISAAIEDATRLGQKALRPNGVPAEQYRSLVNRSGNSYMELRDYANQVFKEIEPVLRAGGSRYSDTHGGFRQNQRVFGHSLPGKFLEQYAGNGRFSVSSALEGEDMLAKHLAFNSALAGYMKANGISVKEAVNGAVKPNGASIERGKEYAFKQAQRATFTEENRAADALGRLENTNAASKVLMGGLMPFKKTPMNILTRGFEYSPAGLAMTFYKLKYAATNSSDKYERAYNMNDVFESLAANMTGTALMYLGYKMAEAGLLAGAADDDNERKSRYDQLMGSQEYALTDPDTGDSWTIDWLAPVAMPLFAGAEVFNQVLMRNENAGDADYDSMIVSALGRIIEPVFEMSCMQGVSDALASYSSGGTEFASSVATTLVTGYAGQFAPQPMAAWARAIDGTVRSSYAPKDSPVLFGKAGETFARQMANRIPVVSQYMQPSIDVWGNERKREGDTVAERLLHNMFNPGNYSSNKRTELDDKLTELYEATGSSTVLPKTAATYIDESEQNPKVYLNSEEYTKFAKTKGQKSQKYVSDFVNSDIYKALDNDAKVDVVADLYSLANYEARKEALAGHSIDFSTKMYENALESGVEPYEYYATKAVGAAAGMTGEFEDVQEKMDICDKLKMDYSTYSELSKTISDLHDSTDANGKTIKGKSRKDKVYATLKKQRDTGVITDEQMWYVWVDNYNAKTRDKKSSLPYWKDCPYKWIVDAKVAEKEAAAEAKKNRE